MDLMDLEARLGTKLEGMDAARAAAALEDVTATVLGLVSPDVAAVWEHAMPGSVKAVVMRAAVRLYTNPAGAELLTVADVSTNFGSQGGLLTGDEVAAVQRAADLSARALGAGSRRLYTLFTA